MRIRIKSRPNLLNHVHEIPFKPDWVLDSYIGLELETIDLVHFGRHHELKSNAYPVRVLSMVESLKESGKLEAADWWKLYFYFTNRFGSPIWLDSECCEQIPESQLLPVR